MDLNKAWSHMRPESRGCTTALTRLKGIGIFSMVFEFPDPRLTEERLVSPVGNYHTHIRSKSLTRASLLYHSKVLLRGYPLRLVPIDVPRRSSLTKVSDHVSSPYSTLNPGAKKKQG